MIMLAEKIDLQSRCISENPLFKLLSHSDLHFVAHYLMEIECGPHQVLLTQGQIGRGLHIIESGKFELSVTLPGDIKKQVAILGPNDFFGETSLLTCFAATISVTALSKGKCLVLTCDILDMFRTYDPALSFNIEHAIANLTAIKIKTLLHTMYDLLNYIHHSEPGSMLQVASHPTKITTVKNRHLNKVKIDTALLLEMIAFKQIDDKEIALLLNYLDVKRYDKGASIKYKDRHTMAYCIIYSGAFQITLKLSSSSLKKITVIGPGEMIGSMFWEQGNENLLEIKARENTVCLTLSKNSSIQLKKQHFNLWIKLHHIVCLHVVSFLYMVDRQLLRIESEYADILQKR